MLPLLLVFLFLPSGHAQFAEIASLATSLLGAGGGAGGLAGLAGTAGSAASGAGGAAGALGQIGQLYQLAQGALQLTGTGVGVLNQASEGNWFPAAIEGAAKNSGGLMGLGPLAPGGRPGSSSGPSIGPEFGTSFPAPDIDDYSETLPEESTPQPPPDFEGLDGDLAVTASSTAPPNPFTLFPEEDLDNLITTEEPGRAIRIELPKKEVSSEEDYFEQVTEENKSKVKITTAPKSLEDLNLVQPERASGTKTLLAQRKAVPNLSKLLEVLRKSNLKEEEIMEIVAQVEGNENIEVPPAIDFNSGVQNIGEKKADNRNRIVVASRALNQNVNGNGNTVPGLATSPPFSHFTPAPFVHPLPPSPHPFVHPFTWPPAPLATHTGLTANNRLQREIQAPQLNKDIQPSITQVSTPVPFHHPHDLFDPAAFHRHLQQFHEQQQEQIRLWHSQHPAPNYNVPTVNYNLPSPNFNQAAAYNTRTSAPNGQTQTQQSNYHSQQAYNSNQGQIYRPAYNTQQVHTNQRTSYGYVPTAHTNNVATNINQRVAQPNFPSRPASPQQFYGVRTGTTQVRGVPNTGLRTVQGNAQLSQIPPAPYVNRQGRQAPSVPQRPNPVAQRSLATTVPQQPRPGQPTAPTARVSGPRSKVLPPRPTGRFVSQRPVANAGANWRATPAPGRHFPTRTARTLALTTPSPVRRQQPNPTSNQLLTRRHSN